MPKHDPIESLRVSSKAAEETPKPEVSAAPPPAKAVAPKKAEPAPIVPSPVPAVRAPRWRVTAAKSVTISGCVQHLKPGKVFSEETHGPGIIQRLQKAGVALEPVEG